MAAAFTPSNKVPVSYATQRVGFLSGMRRGTSMEQQLAAMENVGTLFAIVNAKAEATSMVEWKLWRSSPTGRDEDRVEVTRHLAKKVWDKPNPFYTRLDLVDAFSQHLDLVGEGYLLVERDSRASFPVGLWPIRPDRIMPVPSRNNFISGYVYSGPDGEKVPLTVNEVLRVRQPHPLDPYRGLGATASIWTDLESTRSAAEWNRNFFRNSAEPGGVIEVPEVLGDSEFAQLRQRWNEQHQGVSAAHRVSILEGGMKWVDRKFSQRDMQFAEMRGVSREIIREAFRFPTAMLGTVEDVNRANAEANEVVFARYLILPRLERIKQLLNGAFLPMFGSTGQGVEFDYANPVPEDRDLQARMLTAQADAAKALVDAGLDRAGVLNAVGLPEIPAAVGGVDG